MTSCVTFNDVHLRHHAWRRTVSCCRGVDCALRAALPVCSSHVPESVLKKRAAAQALKAKQASKKVLLKKRNAVKRQLIFKKAQDYAREYQKVRGPPARWHRCWVFFPSLHPRRRVCCACPMAWIAA
jgi:hypothetical protein